MQTYQKIKESKEYQADYNCCTLVASSIVFDLPFKDTQEFYRERGRKYRKGLRAMDAYKCIEHLAKSKKRKYKRVEKQAILKLTSGKTMTVNNCSQYLDENKDYVLFSTNHAIAVKGGKVEDYTAGKRNRILSMYEIETGKVLQPVKVETVSDTLNNLTELMNNLK